MKATVSKKGAAAPTTEEPAESVAFQRAMALARHSAVARLSEAALDLGNNDEYSGHLDTVRKLLEKEQRANGATGSYEPDEFPEEIQDEVLSVATHFAAAGYLYGLALGLALATGGAR